MPEIASSHTATTLLPTPERVPWRCSVSLFETTNDGSTCIGVRNAPTMSVSSAPRAAEAERILLPFDASFAPDGNGTGAVSEPSALSVIAYACQPDGITW